MPVVDDPVAGLAKYWFRARLMHELLHLRREGMGSGIANMRQDDWWEIETYLCFWLSALWVVVEGFNKLKLKDARVQRLFKEHMPQLKAFRHETYHFVATARQIPNHKQLNWAEDLHEGISEFLSEYINKKVREAKKRRRPAKKRRAAITEP